MTDGKSFNSYTKEVCIDDAVLFSLQDGPQPSVAAHSDVGLPNGTGPVKPMHVTARWGGAAANAAAATPAPSPLFATAAPTNAASAPAVASLMTDPTSRTPVVLAPASSQSILSPDVVTPDTPAVNQTVIFTSQKVDHLAEVLTTLNISTYASIKYGSVQGGGSAAFVNEKKFNESDLSYIVSVKVVNETVRKPPNMTFNGIDGLQPGEFTAVFGNFFIADFLWGGEFSALILIKTANAADTKAVQEAVEIQLQTGIPGLTVGAKQSLDKQKSNVLEDCEVTISVSWVGGGNVREGNQNWTIEEVIAVANRFPNLVAQNYQRTSAVLVSYNALRTFQQVQARLSEKMVILDYAACNVYARDLFSAYMAYKELWEDLTLMMRNPEEYQALTIDVDGKLPVGTDPVSLNLARMESRDQMARIVAEAESLRLNPGKAMMPDPDILDSVMIMNGDKRLLAQNVHNAYKFPALLRARLPRYVGAPMSLTDDLWKDGNWSPDEMAVIMKFTADKEHLHFSPPVGDAPKGNRGKPFCTVDASTKDKSPPR